MNQSDFEGRNVILVTMPPTSTDAQAVEMVGGLVMPRVVLVDYNNVWITIPSIYPSPVDPATIGEDSDLWADFGGWVSNEWMVCTYTPELQRLKTE